MSIQSTIADVIELPRNLAKRSAVSTYSLLRDSGYFEMHQQITEDAIREVLARDRENVNEWLAYSEDKRTSSGWFFERGTGSYRVGYVRLGSDSAPPLDYSDGITACAAFIKREVEHVRTEGKLPVM